MKRSLRTWILFSLGAVIVLGVLAFVSSFILEGERERARAQAESDQQALVRTALWRLDSALSPLISNETGRAIAHAVSLPNNYEEPPAFFSLFFTELGKAGWGGYGPTDKLDDDATLLIDSLDLAHVRQSLSDDSSWVTAQTQTIDDNISGLNGAIHQKVTNFQNNDLDIRSQRRAYTNTLNPLANAFGAELGPHALTPFSGFWVEDNVDVRLLLARPGGSDGTFHYVMVDWAKLEPWLLEHIEDVLPGASLSRADVSEANSNQALLTELPLQLTPAAITISDESSQSTIGLLTSAWAAVCLALLCIAVVLHLSLKISKKRARFVSTVTHELRTPITTFRMYSQMLADGMVVGEEKKATYLATLKDESERISRVLESVLLFSRLEEGRAEARRETTDVQEMLDKILTTSSRQAGTLGLELEVDFEAVAEASITTDSQAVEQIVVNLLENAAKYGAADDKRVELKANTEGNLLQISVADHGPGVAASERKAIFKEFHRGAGKHLDGFAGLGLGLALGRELAEGLGGTLELSERDGPGACFILSLPLESVA